MEGASGAKNWTLGCVEFLPMRIGSVSFPIHAHVVEHTPFRLLLSLPFQNLLLCRLEELPDGHVDICIRNPTDPTHTATVSSRPWKALAGYVHTFALTALSSPPPPPSIDALCPYLAEARNAASQQNLSALPVSVAAYKKVARKVRPVPTSLPEDFCTVCRIPEDPLLTLPALPARPPEFSPGPRLTAEWLEDLELNRYNFLWPEELKLLTHVLKLNESGLAWTEAEKGRFRDDYSGPVKIPVIEHIPWAHKNIPVPSRILNEVIQIFKDKLAARVYERSDASYRSRWFCVKKKTGVLHLVHDLQPLNAVTIWNAGVPLLADQLIEGMAGRACYSMLDLFVGYDHCSIDVASRDLTTVQSLIGAVHLTRLPQGWTNVVAIFHDDVTFMLELEIPHIARSFVDDCSVKGPASHYEISGGSYHTIPVKAPSLAFRPDLGLSR